MLYMYIYKALTLEQNGIYFAVWSVCYWIQFIVRLTMLYYLKCVPYGPVANMSALVQLTRYWLNVAWANISQGARRNIASLSRNVPSYSYVYIFHNSKPQTIFVVS